MSQGTIKTLVADRGFGFIAAAEGDVFFHHQAVTEHKFDELWIGQTVTYELAAAEQRGHDKGLCAISVTPA